MTERRNILKSADELGISQDRLRFLPNDFNEETNRANLVNEAALLAARNQRSTVAQEDFNEAIERVVAGLEKKSRVLSEKEKKIVAYHEVGHALVGAVMPGGGRVEKISIVPRGLSALGYNSLFPQRDNCPDFQTERLLNLPLPAE